MSAAEAQRKEQLFARVEKRFAENFQSDPAKAGRWFVPGRIEIFGKHADYAGGRSLLCAVERGFCMAAAARDDNLARIADVSSGNAIELRLRDDPAIARGWEIYPVTVVRRFARNFPGAKRGADIAFASDLPRSAGLSSSSALMIAIFSALAAVNEVEQLAEYRDNIFSIEDLAAYLACVENGGSFRGLSGESGVGTEGGSEDQTAILCCRAGFLTQYSFAPTKFEREVPFDAEFVFAIASSGVAATKTGEARDAYNRASREAREILEIWRNVSGAGASSLQAAMTSSRDAVEEIRAAIEEAGLPEEKARELVKRLEQFVLESGAIVPQGAESFGKRDWRALGELSRASQKSAEKKLGNQIAETSALVRMARERGAIAASAFGAGFGGSVWALVRRADASEFCTEWKADYARSFPNAAPRSEFFMSGAGPGMMKL